MLELLADPITHLIRNSADHGIETPAARLAAGKPEEGVIKLKAFHRSGRIVIEVLDDGGGIPRDSVRAKAIERGLVGADAQLSDEQVNVLIFEPGFSTNETINDLSGRGVGMDVVKRNVQQMNGTVSVVSENGRGTTVTIELPLTLAILEGLLVRVGDRTLVLPLLSVIETVPLRDDKIVRLAEKGEVVVIRNESIPLLRLTRFSGIGCRRRQVPKPPPRRAAIAGSRSLWKPAAARSGWWSMNFSGSNRWSSRAWKEICTGLAA
jgi:two-component system chemotaxis sensor kinase CheA